MAGREGKRGGKPRGRQRGRAADSSGAGEPLGDEAEPGKVVAHHGVAVLVRLDSGEERQIWLTPDQRAVVGDRVRVAGPRLEVLPARGVLQRRDARGRERTIASNLDILALVVAIEPREPPGYLDRGFVIARAADIEPCVLVNKIDLLGSEALADRLTEIYGPSAPVLRVSAETGEGLERFGELLAGGRLGAMVGASGVGKSSLMNALVPDLELEVGALNRGSGKGRHTTTTATLHELEGGGLLVDTAGFKDFLAVDVTRLEVSQYFPGFEAALESGCRFRDCSHTSEPDCAVLAALAAGEIEPARHRAYRALLEEIDETSYSSPRRRG